MEVEFAKDILNCKTVKALCLVGPSGVGKYKLVWGMVKNMVREGVGLLEKGKHPDVLVASGKIPIDDVRSIVSFFDTVPSMSEYKIAIFKNVVFGPRSSEVLLKKLESLRDHERVVFVCDSKSCLTETILSRCIVIEVGYLTPEDIDITSGVASVGDAYGEYARFSGATKWSEIPNVENLLVQTLEFVGSVSNMKSKDMEDLVKEFSEVGVECFIDIVEYAIAKRGRSGRFLELAKVLDKHRELARRHVKDTHVMLSLLMSMKLVYVQGCC